MTESKKIRQIGGKKKAICWQLILCTTYTDRQPAKSPGEG